MATLDDLQTVVQLLATDKILLRQSGTDYSATIDKLQPIVLKPVIDGTVPAAKALSVSAFAICSSAADDPVKTATIENFKLIPGMSISIEIQNGNTANDLKQIAAGTAEDVLKLNISDTGAYEIRIQNISTHGYKGCFTAGGIYEFIFDGTYWICTNSNISAADQSENASYIKYTNGLLIQWGHIKESSIGEWSRTIDGLVSYTTPDFLVLTCGMPVYDTREYCAGGFSESKTSIRLTYNRCRTTWWFTIGF
ncbi:hypothetical protein [Treponema socranskii]|uniref:hypothetical protein n=1 Tax=Treponema socranskii TaxID=53419 RepID=UPI003D6EFDFF